MARAIYKLLIVEDEKMMQDLLIARLSKENIFQIFTADNGQEGLYSAFTNIPDLILLDIRMPVMDGIAMFRELRKDPRGEKIPVIFLTNYDTDEKMLNDISEGRPAYYLIKSNVSMDDVLKKIKESLHI